MPGYSEITGPLTATPNGDLYATTSSEGNVAAAGAVYLLKQPSGYAAKRLLYSFPPDTGYPYIMPYPAGGVTLSHGRIFGAAVTPYDGLTGGMIYDLGPKSALSYATLHTFIYGKRDGYEPMSGLTPGPSHVLVGTTMRTGNYYSGGGIAFSIDENPADPRYRIIHYFGTLPDGADPTNGRLIADATGALYGATLGGGIYGAGTIFQLAKSDSGWSEQIILSTSNIAGQLSPVSGTNVVTDSDGNLIACLKGGIYGYGGVIKLVPFKNDAGRWREQILVQFGAHAYDPNVDQDCGITFNPATGEVTGVTDKGGRYNLGTLMTITPPASPGEGWTYKIDHSFAGTGHDGVDPVFPPILMGNTYYGSTLDPYQEGSLIWAYTP